MSRLFLNNIIRFTVILLLQVLVLKRVNLNIGDLEYFHVIVYPIIIMLLPLYMPKPYVLLIAFASGMFVDIFYDSLGVHASACLLMAYLKPTILGILEPRGGYTYEVPGLGNTEVQWFAGYASFMLLVYLLAYFIMEAFSYVYFVRISLSTILSFIISILIIFVYQIIFRTKA